MWGRKSILSSQRDRVSWGWLSQPYSLGTKEASEFQKAMPPSQVHVSLSFQSETVPHSESSRSRTASRQYVPHVLTPASIFSYFNHFTVRKEYAPHINIISELNSVRQIN